MPLSSKRPSQAALARILTLATELATTHSNQETRSKIIQTGAALLDCESVGILLNLYQARSSIAVFCCPFRGATPALAGGAREAACSAHGSPAGWHIQSVSTDFHELRLDFSPPNPVLQKRNLCPLSVYVLDAEKEPTPEGWAVNWETVKKTIRTAVLNRPEG